MNSRKIESEILEKLVKELSKNFKDCENSEQESQGLDSTDGVVDTFKSILDSIEEEFEQLSGLALDKKVFLRNLSKLILILVSGKCNTVEKIKKLIKIAMVTILKLWPEQK